MQLPARLDDTLAQAVLLVAGGAAGGFRLGELAFRVPALSGAAVLYQVATRVMAVVAWGAALGFAGRQLVAGDGDAAFLLAGTVSVGIVVASDDKTATSKSQINATIGARIGIARWIIRNYQRALVLKCWAQKACAQPGLSIY